MNGICKYCDHCRFIHLPNFILSMVYHSSRSPAPVQSKLSQQAAYLKVSCSPDPIRSKLLTMEVSHSPAPVRSKMSQQATYLEVSHSPAPVQASCLSKLLTWRLAASLLHSRASCFSKLLTWRYATPLLQSRACYLSKLLS